MKDTNTAVAEDERSEVYCRNPKEHKVRRKRTSVHYFCNQHAQPKKIKRTVNEIQSAYLCGLQLQTEFLKHVSVSDLTKKQYWDLKIGFENYFKRKRRIRVFCNGEASQRRKSLNLNFNEQNCTLIYDLKKTYKNTKNAHGMRRVKREVFEGGMCCKEEDRGRRPLQNVVIKYKKSKSESNLLSKEEDSIIFATPEESSLQDSSLEMVSDLKGFDTKDSSRFDIFRFVIERGIASFETEELPLTKTRLLKDLKKREVLPLETVDDTQVRPNSSKEMFSSNGNKLKIDISEETVVNDNLLELILFGDALNFKKYKDSALRDLLQLSYASFKGVIKDFIKLKLLQCPERIEEVSKGFKDSKSKEIRDNDLLVKQCKDVIFDLYFLFYKKKLDKQEIEVFNKIIYWLTTLKEGLSKDRIHRVLNRVKIDFTFYNRNYLILVEFVEKTILNKHL